jgi:hypothetical protein
MALLSVVSASVARHLLMGQNDALDLGINYFIQGWQIIVIGR